MMLKKLHELLRSKKYTIGSAESLTAGLFASTFCAEPGASELYLGGIITYTKQTKISMLNLDEQLLERYGVVSSECACMMAESAQKKLGVNVAVSLTGNAGPSALENKPVGLVYIGVKINELPVVIKELHLTGERNEIRQKVVDEAIAFIIQQLK